MFLAGAFTQLGLHMKAQGNVDAARGWSSGAVAMIFLFTATFGATWLTVPWLYPAEIFPLEVRAKGNAWGVVGWSVGNGWLTLMLPIVFKALGEKTYYIFGIANVITLPMVYCLYPESNQRTLEEMNLVFASDSPWVWNCEKNYRLLKEQNPELVQAAERGHSVVDPETGLPKRASMRAGRNMSLDANAFSPEPYSIEKATYKHDEKF